MNLGYPHGVRRRSVHNDCRERYYHGHHPAKNIQVTALLENSKISTEKKKIIIILNRNTQILKIFIYDGNNNNTQTKPETSQYRSFETSCFQQSILQLI